MYEQIFENPETETVVGRLAMSTRIWSMTGYLLSLSFPSPPLPFDISQPEVNTPETWNLTQTEGAEGEALYPWLQDWEKECLMFRVWKMPPNLCLLFPFSCAPGPKQSRGDDRGGSCSDWNQQELKLWENFVLLNCRPKRVGQTLTALFCFVWTWV